MSCDDDTKATDGGTRALALAELEQYRARLRRSIHRRVRNAADAEDLTQDTLVRAADQIGTLRDPRAVLGWLLRIAARLTIDHLRRRSRWGDGRSLDDVSLPEAAAGGALQHSAERAEMSRCVQESIRLLPEGYRTALELHDVLGLTAPEVAALRGESVGAAKIRLHRARQRLKAALEEGCELSRDRNDVLVCGRRSAR